MQVAVDRRAICGTRRVDVIDDLGTSVIVSSVWVVFLTSVEFSSTLVLGVSTSVVDVSTSMSIVVSSFLVVTVLTSVVVVLTSDVVVSTSVMVVVL